jgi:PPK2 family polyphosphate:nucleotide phosphotransferase
MPQNVVAKSRIQLKDFDPAEDFGLKKEKTREATRRLLERIGGLQAKLYANTRRSVLVVLQGMDASGKDGATKSLLEFVNPAGVEVTDFKAPSSEELAHDFLWRVHARVPAHGRIGIFNRSHYEDVVVVRVRKLVPKDVWKERFAQINAFERFLHGGQVTFVKCFLHISREEQRKRLEDRLKDPKKQWKLGPADLDDRHLWDDFTAAYEDALTKCSTPEAPWHIVPANKKWYRNLVVARLLRETLERIDPRFPPFDPTLISRLT